MKKTMLHVGCGGSHLPPPYSHCEEIRLDIDESVKPDIVADIAHLPEGLGPFDGVFACHCVEHLYPYDIDPCLSGFLRVLKPRGIAIVLVPDLEDVQPTDAIVYVSPAGPITGHDMFYGFGPALAAHPYMAHHTGFTQATLRAALERNGFVDIQIARMSNECFGLYAIGRRP